MVAPVSQRVDSLTGIRAVAALLARPDAVVSRDRLLATGWPHDPEVGRANGQILDGRIKLLRRRLVEVGMEIHTVRGVGFVLVSGTAG